MPGPATSLDPQQLAALFEGVPVDTAYFDALVSNKHGVALTERLFHAPVVGQASRANSVPTKMLELA